MKEGCTTLIEVRVESRKQGSAVFQHLILSIVFFFSNTNLSLRNAVNAMLTFWRWLWANPSKVLQWHECALSSCWWVTLRQSPRSSTDTTVTPATTAGFLVRIKQTDSFTLSFFDSDGRYWTQDNDSVRGGICSGCLIWRLYFNWINWVFLQTLCSSITSLWDVMPSTIYLKTQVHLMWHWLVLLTLNILLWITN